MCSVMQSSLRRFQQCDVISVAAVEGKAVGGGAELTTGQLPPLASQCEGVLGMHAARLSLVYPLDHAPPPRARACASEYK